jgi:Fic family protein
MSEPKQIIPFHPRPFPPRNVKKRAFLPLLKKAHRALQDYRNLLETTPCPTKLLSHLVTLEGIESLDSQNIHVPIAKFLTSTEKRLAPIHDYLEALSWASRDIAKHPFSKKQICRIHKIAKRATAPKMDLGRYRNRQNWIGPSNCSIEEAYFYPPEKNEVARMMEELFRYLKRSEKEPLLQLALAFAQLLIIHPFMDGNGRIARIWISLFLYQKKILPIPFFFMSGYFKKHRVKYYQSLYKTTEEKNWEEWIAFFLKGVVAKSQKSCRAMKKIIALEERLSKEAPHLNQAGRAFLFQHPIFTSASFKKTKNSSQVLQELKKDQWIRESKDRKLHFVPMLKILKQSQKQ